MKEHAIQNAIRNALAGICFTFRANVGRGWQGQGKPFRATTRTVVSLNPGDVVLRNARPFDTGLPGGFSDLFGWVEVEITPAMIGKKFARFFSMEVKSEKGKEMENQSGFRKVVIASGGVASVVRNEEQALAIIAAVKDGTYD